MPKNNINYEEKSIINLGFNNYLYFINHFPKHNKKGSYRDNINIYL